MRIQLLVVHVGGDRNRDDSKSFPHLTETNEVTLLSAVGRRTGMFASSDVLLH